LGPGESEAYHNILGAVGAHLGFVFARQGLGIGSLLVPFFLAVFGLRWLTDKPIVPLGKSLRLGLFLALYVPLTLAFVSRQATDLKNVYTSALDDHIVGAAGLWMMNQCALWLETLGTALLILVAGGSLMMLQAPRLTKRLVHRLSSWFKTAEATMLDEDAEDEAAVQESASQRSEDRDAGQDEGAPLSATNRLLRRDQEQAAAAAAGLGSDTPAGATGTADGTHSDGQNDASDATDDVPFEVTSPDPVAAGFLRPTATATASASGTDEAPEDTTLGGSHTGSDEAALDAGVTNDHMANDHSATPAAGTEGASGTSDMPDVGGVEGAESDGDADDDVEFEVKEAQEEEMLTSAQLDDLTEEFGEYDPTLELARFQLPNIDKLENHGDGKNRVTDDELTQNKENILRTLANFNIEVSKITAEVGPTVTLYEIVPAPGIRISKIKNLEDDIALSLAALGIRIIAPIPGKGTIGIEVPNSNPDVVSMRTLIASDKFQNSDAALPIALGKTISNETFVFDMAKMPHLLMAGATGQGKSVGLNAMLVSMLYRKHPSQLKFVLVDPKKVELTLYNKIERHYLAQLPDSEDAIITDTSKVVSTLNSLCVEMDQRYELLKAAQCRNIKEYNAKFSKRKMIPGVADGHPENGKEFHRLGHHYMPYIVLVVDEFADLIMTAGKEVETPIARLAQLARAIGIHLIIATQRPSVNIITGTIKANFPARVAFRVTSKIDSRTILDAGGADQLIGRGDMLMSTGNDLIRLQCGFVDTPEVEDICEFIGSQTGYPSSFILPPPPAEANDSSGPIDDDERDPMFEDAARVLVMHQQGSTSLLQRKLKLGYNRAGRLIDQLESAGIIGPFEGSKARKVLVPDEASLEQMLQGSSESSD
jgi:DNA segregation ATPase FtsK/SpoIIIE-like protein